MVQRLRLLLSHLSVCLTVCSGILCLDARITLGGNFVRGWTMLVSAGMNYYYRSKPHCRRIIQVNFSKRWYCRLLRLPMLSLHWPDLLGLLSADWYCRQRIRVHGLVQYLRIQSKSYITHVTYLTLLDADVEDIVFPLAGHFWHCTTRDTRIPTRFRTNVYFHQ